MNGCGKTDSDELWWTYLAEYDNRPGSIVLNLALHNRAPIAGLPYLVVTGVNYPASGANGLPDNKQELNVLNALADKRLKLMQEQKMVVLAGSFTHNTERLDYLYIESTNGIADALKKFYQKYCPDRKPYINVKEDAKWETYLDFLFPNEQTIRFYREELTKLGFFEKIRRFGTRPK